MARSKKKAKQNKSAPEAPRSSAPATRPQTEPGKAATPLVKQPDRQQPVVIKKGVSRATFVAGMFLTLVMGIYLGTLFPGVVNEIQTPGPVERAESVPQAPEAPQEQRMDPELLKMVSELEKKAAANPDSVPDWINLGNIYFDAFMPDKAIPAYEHALRLAPKNADVLTDLGIMYRETGQFEKAVEYFRRAIAISPRHENAMYNEGVVLSVDLKKKDEAIAAWKRLLDINPHAHSPAGKPVTEMLQQLQ